MAAPTDTFVDPADGAANGSDHGGAAFIDGVFNSGAPNTLTSVGDFTAATCQAGDKIYLDDNGSGEVTAGLYTISTRDSNDQITLTADIRSGGAEPTDVRCDQHDGTVGTPWATVQHHLDFTTRDAVNGDRCCARDTADDVLAAALDFSTYGTPAAGAPWILQGYTNAAGDGGIGGISGGGAVGIVLGDALDYLSFVDMHLHNTGAVDILSLDTGNSIVNCEIDNTTARGLDLDDENTILGCYIHNIGNDGITLNGDAGTIAFCTLENGANKFLQALQLSNGAHNVMFNVIDISDSGGSSDGIASAGDGSALAFNSVFADAGTGTGIRVTGGSQRASIYNNIVEGFSGIGGLGIELTAVTDFIIYGPNAFYNNTANLLNNTNFIRIDNSAGDVNLTPTGISPFIDAANGDFRITSALQALGYPTDDYPGLSVRSYLDIGALQRKSQMIIHPGMGGGARS